MHLKIAETLGWQIKTEVLEMRSFKVTVPVLNKKTIPFFYTSARGKTV